MTLLSNFSERSIQFNIVVSVVFLIKCFLGARYRPHKSFTMLRWYIIMRFFLDLFLLVPVLAYFLVRSSTSAYNLIIVFLIISISELIVILRNINNLYAKSDVECLEMLQPDEKVNLNGFPQQSFYLWHYNIKLRSFVL
jgi:hypothetical protein